MHDSEGHLNEEVDKHPSTRVAFVTPILSAGGMMKKSTGDLIIGWKRVLAPSIWARMMESIAIRLIEVPGSSTGGCTVHNQRAHQRQFIQVSSLDSSPVREYS